MSLQKIEEIIYENKSNQIILWLTEIKIDLIKNGRDKECLSWWTSSQTTSKTYSLWIRSCHEESFGGLVEGTLEGWSLGWVRL
mgnify:CR=1 FL=1|jgi:hypothetical protein